MRIILQNKSANIINFCLLQSLFSAIIQIQMKKSHSPFVKGVGAMLTSFLASKNVIPTGHTLYQLHGLHLIVFLQPGRKMFIHQDESY